LVATGNVSDIGHYIKLGPLGRAFPAEERHVLLIHPPSRKLRRADWISALPRSGISMEKIETHIPEAVATNLPARRVFTDQVGKSRQSRQRRAAR